jgi:fructokinase
MAYGVFDIGGTTTRVGLSVDGATLATHTRYKTPVAPDQGIKLLQDSLHSLAAQENQSFTGIAGGIRGRLCENRRSLETDTVLTKWSGYPLVESLEQECNVPVYLENDAALAGVGEAVSGAAREFDLVVYHTISTGVGGVKVERGYLDDASVGFEPGHQIIDIDRTVLGEDITPTLENLVSGRAVEERMGVKPYEISQSDTLWDTLAQYLGQGLRNSILYWSPEVIVLGGSMITGDPCIQLDSIRKHTVAALDGFVEAPFITHPALGDDAGLYGGLAILKQNLEA